MDLHLQPQDDGLIMRSSGPWAAEKLDYLKRYIDVFETSMRTKWPVRYYVDLLAGPGKDRIRDTGEILLGSPLISLAARFPFTHYFFSDISPENTKALRTRCTSSSEFSKVQIRTGDCNELVGSVVSEIRRDDNSSLNLSFLDSQGLELKWDTVALLSTARRMDLIINYPQGGLSRYMGAAIEAEDVTLVDQFFGDSKWREIYQEAQSKGRVGGVHRLLIDYYKQKLRTLGYQEIRQDDETGDEPLIRNAKKRAPLYRLLFASKHTLGHDFWQKVTRRNIYGQGRLF